MLLEAAEAAGYEATFTAAEIHDECRGGPRQF